MRGASSARVRFGGFELNLPAGELWNGNTKVVLQEQPLLILRMLIERDGELLRREEIKKKFWPNDTVVEFDHSINAAIKNLRRALGDSAEEPRYIQTFPRRGYRLMVPVERLGSDDSSASASEGAGDTAVRGQREPGLIAEKVSHYRVLEVIGGGGMGMVYKAEDLKLGRHVALKFLPPQLASDPVALQRLEREARAASSLNHPNIVTIYECGQVNELQYIVSEYVDGITLRKKLSQGRLELETTLDIAIQLAGALEAAHAAGIIHRDIKPENVMVRNDGLVKILDFGIAKLSRAGGQRQATDARLSSVNQPGTLIGTVAYMSPEQATGKEVDSRTDLFSFGVVLYEMATGKPPFAGKTSAVVFKAILDVTAPPPSHANQGIPLRLDEVIGKCLEKDSELRYQFAADLRSDLKRIKRDNDSERISPRVGASRPASRENPIRLMVVDDHPVFRQGLAVLIEDQTDMTLVGEASNGREAIQQFRVQRPDITLMDLQMPDMCGLDATIAIRNEFPDARIVVLTTYSGDMQVLRALKAGAQGYLLKNLVHKELLDTIRAVHAGRKALSPEASHEIATHATDDALTPEEVTVLRLIAAGNANKEIASQLSISEETVETRVKNILSKMGANDRTHAVMIGLKRGIIEL